MRKELLKKFIPPILISLYRRLRFPDKNPNILFDGDDTLFKELTRSAQTYGEYGCGKSTKWVVNNTSAKVIAVDTSEEWVDVVRADNSEDTDRLNIQHVDLGDLGAWGRPIDYGKRASFSDYTDHLWNQDTKPDVVLVDGRFRVCCFLTSLKFAAEGTQILFDDYTNRPHYHVVEKYAARERECGRQCLFVVPEKSKLDFDELEKDITAFRHVMD